MTTAEGAPALRFTGYADILATYTANIRDWLNESATSSEIAARQAALYFTLQTGTEKPRRRVKP